MAGKKKADKPKRDPLLYCKACGVVRDRNVPRPLGWDSHVGEQDMMKRRDTFETCSKECRALLGIAERYPEKQVSLEDLW